MHCRIALLVLTHASIALAQPAGPVGPVQPGPTVEITDRRVEVDRAPFLSSDALFEVGEATFKKDGAALIDAVGRALAKDTRAATIVIEVHSDDVAPDGDRTGGWLVKLTQARADAIKAQLVRRGVPAKRLAARGLAASVPVQNNQSDDGRRANRRVELIVDPEVRPPTAADLAGYLAQVKGTGNTLVATIETTQGTLHCTLWPDRTPMTIANFVGLATGQKSFIDPKTKKVARRPFYDGLVFHRVIPGFMIQGGDPLGVGTGGPGYVFANEIAPDLTNRPGTLAMANAGPNTNGSQFFLNEIRSQHLDGRHTVFGQCKELDVIQKIAAVPREPNDRPTTPVAIKRVTFAKVQEAAPAPSPYP
jgi:peptidyl-prolyl cis-trans isomerase A (cyclophilin A)